MNDMNSLIIEGQVKEISTSRDSQGVIVCAIVMATRRFYRTSSGEPTEETAEFDVECKGTVAEQAARKGYSGRGIRVVGRLCQRTADNGQQKNKVYVFADYIEYKLDLRKLKKQEEEK